MSKQALIFGWHAVRAALTNSNICITDIYRLANQKNDSKIAEIQQFCDVHQLVMKELTRPAMDELANTTQHQGIIAYCEEKVLLTEDDIETLLDKTPDPAFILILDQIQDPHNLGAILRTADAAGVHLVVAPKDRAVSITPTVKKVASGAAESVPFIQVTNLARTIRALKERGIWVYGLAADSALSIYQQKLTGSIAIVMGAEGQGLRLNVKNHCDQLLSIPMAGLVSSLNVSVATGIVLFEVIRQKMR